MDQRDDFVSFEKDIKPLFREMDIDHMGGMGVLLDDYEYMSESNNAQRVYDFLMGKEKPQMPIGGPYWSEEQLELFARWMKKGHKP